MKCYKAHTLLQVEEEPPPAPLPGVRYVMALGRGCRGNEALDCPSAAPRFPHSCFLQSKGTLNITKHSEISHHHHTSEIQCAEVFQLHFTCK